ncbi:ATP-binding protein [uncultured Hoeflea sp.]|uniref:ATP-binding protein n=1 Tax=uncultured Hoeflea sp. TaxID=538666 RepID=UPI00262B793C|nr:ATP-binding protein [uncultured Hoeflea sp.]
MMDSGARRQGSEAGPASRPLFLASTAMAAAALSVAFNAPSVLMASVAGIAVLAAMPLIRRAIGRPAERSGHLDLQSNPTGTGSDHDASGEHDIDRHWELGEVSSQIANLFDALGDMAATRDLDGHVLHANDVFRTATGCAAPAGLTLAATGIEPDAAVEGGGREVRLGHGDEETIWLWRECTARDPASGALVVHCIGRDITAARKAEAELVEAREKAEAASTAKTRFLATVSHEIRTPLNGILGMTHLLEQTDTTPEQSSYIRTAYESGQSLLSLIEDLLDVTSIEAGRLNLRSEEGDLEELVHGVCELMASRAHEKGIEIAVHIANDAPRRLTSDIGRLRQVLFNLVGNAIKFTESGGVLVEVSLDNDDLAFAVTDTGPGLKDEDKARIFKEFERADNGPTRRYGGAGLGLSISARIVEALGGEIGVTSTLGKGSTFHFTAPFEQAGPTDQMERHRGPLSDRAVLVIAPRGPVSTAMLWAIRDLGGHAEAAHDADSMLAALSRLNRTGADLSDIIVDRRMADDADALLATAPTVLPDKVARTLVIAPEDSRDLEGHGAHGADAWLVRPVRRSSLENVLTRRDDREDRNRLAAKPRPPVLERASDNPTLDILLAEDDPVNALVVRTLLARQGHRVTVVDTGLKLVEEAMQRPGGTAQYDLIITDLSMPDLDGRSAIIRIRDHEEINQLQRLPVIVLSADGHASTRDDLLAAGADGHAEKPVDPEWLISLAAVTARKRDCATG